MSYLTDSVLYITDYILLLERIEPTVACPAFWGREVSLLQAEMCQGHSVSGLGCRVSRQLGVLGLGLCRALGV